VSFFFERGVVVDFIILYSCRTSVVAFLSKTDYKIYQKSGNLSRPGACLNKKTAQHLSVEVLSGRNLSLRA
jgi:hypothetical protein